MPANLTPQYREAEQRFREARSSEDKIAALEEMIRLLPKHKGTDHLFADLKRRLSKLRSGKGQKKGSARQRSPYHILPSGAGQAVLIGLPNAGKSAIVAALTSKAVEVAPYPFTTRVPLPAMMPYENAQVELIDTPPVTLAEVDPELVALLRRARLCLLVLDLSDDTLLEAVDGITARLEARRTRLMHHCSEEVDGEDGSVALRTLLVGTHADVAAARENLELLRELVAERFAIHPVNTLAPEDMEALRKAIWEALAVIRIYSQPHGKKADRTSPFYLPRGATVLDFAARLHQDFAENLKSARVWGSALYHGQHVKADHRLQDEDVVELNT
ncbi:MAG: TGS domain-containing protein [Planctomycetes bacterium]|nr:TGS domain-containing protein [Planctomycetota bacterium]